MASGPPRCRGSGRPTSGCSRRTRWGAGKPTPRRIGCIASLGLLGLYFEVPALHDNATWVATAALVAYIASFAIGLGPVFWLMIAEIFPLRVRGPAMAACTVTNWGFNFAISFTFLSLVSAVSRTGTFWIYGGLGLVALGLFAWRVPETKGRSLEQIESEVGATEIGATSA